MAACSSRCPAADVPCAGSHPPTSAHHATGVAEDGTCWSVTWWPPGLAAAELDPRQLLPPLPRRAGWAAYGLPYSPGPGSRGT